MMKWLIRIINPDILYKYNKYEDYTSLRQKSKNIEVVLRGIHSKEEMLLLLYKELNEREHKITQLVYNSEFEVFPHYTFDKQIGTNIDVTVYKKEYPKVARYLFKTFVRIRKDKIWYRVPIVCTYEHEIDNSLPHNTTTLDFINQCYKSFITTVMNTKELHIPYTDTPKDIFRHGNSDFRDELQIDEQLRLKMINQKYIKK